MIFHYIMDTLKPIRRFVDADNSCLFSSIAYLTDKNNFNETSSGNHRMMVVEYLQNNEFDDFLLDSPKHIYINEIADPSKWGGGIEIKIFTEILKLEIGVVDVQTNRIDIFGQDQNYTSRIYLLYNGIHYDPLVLNFDESSEPDTDVTIFDSEDESIANKFKALIQMIHQKGDFIDLSKLHSLECTDCKVKFLNQETATTHANKSSHWNFKQI